MAILKGLGAEPAHCDDVYTYIYIDVTQTPKNLIPERSSCGFSHRCCIVFLTLWSFCCLGPALESCYAVDRCVSPCRLLHGLKSICQACCDPLSFLRRKHAKARAQEICPRGAFAWLQYISHTQHIKALVSDFGCILWFLDQLCWIPVNWAVSALGVPLCTACVLILPEGVD